MTGVYSVRGDEPIFEVEHLAKVLILSLIADPAAANYRSKQFEYNRLMKVVGEPKTRHVLFDFAACQKLDCDRAYGATFAMDSFSVETVRH